MLGGSQSPILARRHHGKHNDRENKDAQKEVRKRIVHARHMHSPPWLGRFDAFQLIQRIGCPQ